MKNKNLLLLASCFLILFSCDSRQENKTYSDELTEQAVLTVTDDVMNWQMNAYDQMNVRRRWKANNYSWENAIYLTAAAEWSALRQDRAMAQWVRAKAKENDYRLGNGDSVSHVYHADHLIVGMLYADLYEQDGDVRMIYPTVARLQFIKNNPSPYGLECDNSDKTYKYKQRWSWCDALYMAPQVFARYAQIWNDPSLLEFMNNEYWFTTDYLYNKEYHLYWRDSNYFDQLEANGKPVFWGRGNGWVIGGLAKLIPYLPEQWSGRQRFVDHYKSMMDAIVALQSPEGHWFVTMLDPESYPNPEMSSTGFFCYALWWGINYGILDEATYLEPATRAWKAMIHAVRPTGMLGSVQAVGEKPEAITADMTEVYGPAAMSYAAQEILKYLSSKK